MIINLNIISICELEYRKNSTDLLRIRFVDLLIKS